QRLGWTEGRNVRIEYRWSAGDAGREKASAAELVRSTPNVIVVSGWTGLAELKRLTSKIPIVFTHVSDPVGSGLIASLARPGANISGFQNFEPAIGGKWLGVLKDAAPNMPCQSSSSSRFTAEQPGILHLSQSGERPER